MQSVVDERGRVLIPRELRSEMGLDEGTVVQVEREGERALVMIPAKRRRLSWKDLNGMKPSRTGRPVWPTPEEIKSIWE